MPEGDTLFRIATTLGRALKGKALTRFASPLPALATTGLPDGVGGAECHRRALENG